MFERRAVAGYRIPLKGGLPTSEIVFWSFGLPVSIENLNAPGSQSIAGVRTSEEAPFGPR